MPPLGVFFFPSIYKKLVVGGFFVCLSVCLCLRFITVSVTGWLYHSLSLVFLPFIISFPHSPSTTHIPPSFILLPHSPSLLPNLPIPHLSPYLPHQTSVDVETVWNYVAIAKELRSKFPDFVAGFDLVGQEDLGLPLKDFLEPLLSLSEGEVPVPVFYHAGETGERGGEEQMKVGKGRGGREGGELRLVREWREERERTVRREV